MSAPERTPDGYRREPLVGSGPRVRADVVDVYVFRRTPGAGIEFLQLLRAKDPLGRTWQPIMGHVEPGETAVATALRELREEVGLEPTASVVGGFWALEQVWPFFIAAIDCVVLSPRFAAEVTAGWEPTLNTEHAAHRWVAVSADPDHPDDRAALERHFMWSGQRQAILEILREIVRPDSQSRERLRITLD